MREDRQTNRLSKVPHSLSFTKKCVFVCALVLLVKETPHAHTQRVRVTNVSGPPASQLFFSAYVSASKMKGCFVCLLDDRSLSVYLPPALAVNVAFF